MKETTGTLIRRSLGIFREKFFVLAPFILFLDGPMEFLSNYVVSVIDPGNLWPQALLAFLSLAVYTLLFPSALYALVQALDGRKPPRFRQALAWGAGCWWRFFGWNCVYGLLVMFWCMALILPGLVVFLRYSLLGTVLVLEGKKQKNPLGRSRDILRGHWRTLSGAVLALLFLPFLVLASGELYLTYGLHWENHWVLLALYDLATDFALFPYSILTLVAYRAWASPKAA